MNRRYGRNHVLIALAVLVASLCTASQAKTWTKELALGVVYSQIVESPGDPGVTVPRVINILKINPKAPGVQIRSVLGNDKVNDLDPTRGREDMGSIARRLKAIAVVNTDFCNWTGDPLGIHIEKGELVSEPYPRRTMFGMTADGKCLFDTLGWDAKVTLSDGKSMVINGIDRDRAAGELMAYTSKWFASTCTDARGSEAVITTKDLPVRLGASIKGKVTALKADLGDTPIPSDGIVLSGIGPASDFVKNNLKEGTEVTLNFNVVPTETTGWEKVAEAFGGTPRILRHGEICTDFEKEGIGTSHVETTHPRSAVGVTADGLIVLATVDGRQSFATGMSLPDLAKLMKFMGCVDALSLDGGGSTTMATYFGILNSPSDGKLRALPNGVAVFAPEPKSSPAPDFKIYTSSGRVASGDSLQLSLMDASTGAPLKTVLANKAIWSTEKGIGFVDQSGRFIGYKTGKVQVVVRLGSKMANAEVETFPGLAKRLGAEMTDNSSANVYMSILAISATDCGANGVPGVEVQVRVTGGTLADPTTDIVTGDDGTATIGISWDAPTGGQVEITSGDLKPVVIQRSDQKTKYSK